MDVFRLNHSILRKLCNLFTDVFLNLISGGKKLFGTFIYEAF